MKKTLPIGSIDIPENWEDRTNYQFVSQQTEGLETPMAFGHPVHTPHTSLLLSLITLPKRTNLDQYLLTQIEELRQVLRSFKLNSRDPWVHPVLGKVATIDCSFEIQPGKSVRQLQFYAPNENPDTFVLVTVSVAESQYKNKHAEIEHLFASFQPS